MQELFDLVTEIADQEPAPLVGDGETGGEFPRDVLKALGRSGLLGLPYPGEYGGGGQPYEVYLGVLELLARRWLTQRLAIARSLRSGSRSATISG